MSHTRRALPVTFAYLSFFKLLLLFILVLIFRIYLTVFWDHSWRGLGNSLGCWGLNLHQPCTRPVHSHLYYLSSSVCEVLNENPRPALRHIWSHPASFCSFFDSHPPYAVDTLWHHELPAHKLALHINRGFFDRAIGAELCRYRDKV